MNLLKIISASWEILLATASFVIIIVASRQISGLFQKIKLPLITGMLFMGIICGPYVLNLISVEYTARLGFVNDFALAFIAFAAGAELYLKELRSRFRSIRWITTGQLVLTFILASLFIYFLADLVPFMQTLSPTGRIAVAILVSTIFVARSPVTAIAIINELRAKGPFTHTTLGVTVLIDVLVIVLFAIVFSISKTLLTGIKFNLLFILFLLTELIISSGIGYLLGRFLEFLLSRRMSTNFKALFILLSGFGIYLLAHLFSYLSDKYLSVNFYIEPLLICIIASFIVTNFTRYRREFLKIIHDTIPFIYVTFFTLIGATIDLEILLKIWSVALVFFFIRLGVIMIGTWAGGTLGREPFRYIRIGWMPYITQAGVSLGLVTIVATEFIDWGPEFATLMVSVIILNQITGPPMFKFAIGLAGEDHSRGKGKLEGIRRVIIFGYEDQSLALARQLAEHEWLVQIATLQTGIPDPGIPNVTITHSSDFSFTAMMNLKADKVDTIVAMKTDEENLKICELAYEHFGTHEMVVRLNHRFNMKRFHDLGVLIVEPATAMVSLLDHFVRSPMATSLLLGMEENQDTVDLVVRNPNLHGMALRNLHLPSDILILSTKRKGHPIISTGYTRLRKGDTLTVVGSVESIEQVRLRFE